MKFTDDSRYHVTLRLRLFLWSSALGASLMLATTTAYSMPIPSKNVLALTASSFSATDRWVNVAAATLWVHPRTARLIDRPAISKPVDLPRWVSDMSVAQKSWLVGRLETQALFATKVIVLSSSNGWSHVLVTTQPTPRDVRGYPGWMRSVQLTAHSPIVRPTFAVVSSNTTWLHRTANVDDIGNQLMQLSFDTRLPIVAVGARTVQVALLDGTRGFIRRSGVRIQSSTSAPIASGARVLATGRQFMGLQYLWAGTSAFGYDCSGFTYSVFHELGVVIPRDAAPQSLRGTKVARSALKNGDLVFFKDQTGTVVHVGIFFRSSKGEALVLHSPGTGVPVRITPLASWNLADYAGARRYTVAP